MYTNEQTYTSVQMYTDIQMYTNEQMYSDVQMYTSVQTNTNVQMYSRKYSENYSSLLLTNADIYCILSNGIVAQLVRVPDCLSGGCRFKSGRSRCRCLSIMRLAGEPKFTPGGADVDCLSLSYR